MGKITRRPNKGSTSMASWNCFEAGFSFSISLHTPHANRRAYTRECMSANMHQCTHRYTQTLPHGKTHSNTVPSVGRLSLWLKNYKSKPREREGVLGLCLRYKGAECVSMCVCTCERFKGNCRAMNPLGWKRTKGRHSLITLCRPLFSPLQ